MPKAQPSPSEVRRDQRQAMFDELRESAEFVRALQFTPSLSGTMLQGGCTFGFIGLWTAATLTMALFASRLFLPMAIVPLLMGLGGIAMLVSFARKSKAFGEAPLAKEAAVIVSRRNEVDDDSTENFVTLEFEEGDREEFRISGATAGRLAEGDVGVAYVKGEVLLDFRRMG